MNSYRDNCDTESIDLSVKSQFELGNDKNRIIDEIISTPSISDNLEEYEDQFVNNYIYSIVSDNTCSSDELENFNLLLADDTEDFANYEPPQKIKKTESPIKE